MMKNPTDIAKRIRLVGTIAVVALLASQPAKAADLFWSGDGTNAGGVGTWNTTTAHWAGASGGPYTTVWDNTANAGDRAIFDGTAASVTVGTVTVNSITFSPSPVAAYTLTGGTITFSGANPTITVNTGGTTNTTLTSVYTGTSQLTKMGIGRLELNASTNTLVGGYNIQQGFINLAAANRLGTTAATIPVTVDPDWFVFGGGGLTSSNATAQDLGATRGVTLAGKAWLGASATGNPITISAPITGTGDIIISNATTTAVNGGSATPLSTTFNAGGIWTLGNIGNNWTGDAQIGSGTLRAGTSNVIPDGSIVHLTNSGVQFDLGTNNTTETVKAISGTAGTVAVGASGSLTVNVPTSESYTYASVFTATTGGTGKVTKDGAGTWILSGGSTGFNGEFVMNAGTLGIGGNNIFGNTSNTSKVAYNGGTLSNNGTGGRTIAAPIPLAINADLTADDSLFNSSQPGQMLFNGPATMNADRTFTINGTANFGLADLRESGGSRNIVKAGSGTLALTGAVVADPNAFTGSVTVQAGRLQISTTSFIGNESNQLILAGGALNSSGNRDVSTAMIKNPITLTADSAVTTTSTAATVNLNLNTSSFTLTGGTTLKFRNDGANDATDLFAPRFSGSGFNFTSNIDIDNGAVGKTQLASFNQSSTQTFSGVISGTGSYRRSSGSATNGGTTIFSNANTLQGGIAINDGKLQASNGVSGSATGTGQVTVGDGNSGTTFRGYLTGTGTVGNATTGPVVAQEGGIIAPGDYGSSPGTLTTLGDVTMGLNSHMEIDLSGASADKLAVGGNLDLSAAEFLDVSGIGSGSSWIIATYVGTLSGIFDNITSGYTVDYGTGTNSQITLNASACAPGDLNCDTHVDAGDYVFWRMNNSTPAGDYDTWRANFGVPPGAGSGGGLSGSTVPEPSAIVLLVMGLVAAAVRRRG